MPTTSGWMVVPGGWSIGVEFTFYFLFPILASVVTSLPRASMLVVVTLLLGAVSNYCVTDWLAGYAKPARENFLYFWFPNQAPVFALGFVLYFLVSGASVKIKAKMTAYGLLSFTLLFCVLTAEVPAVSSTLGVPPILLATLGFMGFIFILARGPETVFSHPAVRYMGTLSFSAYVLHFLFVHRIPGWSLGLIDARATGYSAIASGAALWVLTVACTVAAAAVAHKFIEQPGIALAQRLTSRRRGALAEHPAVPTMSGL